MQFTILRLHFINMGMNLLSWTILILSVSDICGRPSRKIIGPAKHVCSGQRSYQVTLMIPRIINDDLVLSYICAGVILDSTHILTAAHCVIGANSSGIYIGAGCVSADDERQEFRKSTIFSIHPNYHRGKIRSMDHEMDLLLHDIAVMTIKIPLLLGPTKKAVNLPAADVKPHQVGEIGGWGLSTIAGSNDTKLSTVMLKTSMSILPRKCCPFSIPTSLFCAIDPKHRTTIAHGDSGSPFIVNDTVVGIASNGLKATNLPSYYTNVFPHLEFIESVMKRK